MWSRSDAVWKEAEQYGHGVAIYPVAEERLCQYIFQYGNVDKNALT
jgi:hypothetical protein